MFNIFDLEIQPDTSPFTGEQLKNMLQVESHFEYESQNMYFTGVLHKQNDKVVFTVTSKSHHLTDVSVGDVLGPSDLSPLVLLSPLSVEHEQLWAEALQSGYVSDKKGEFN